MSQDGQQWIGERGSLNNSDRIVETDAAGEYVGYHGRTYYSISHLRRVFWRGLAFGLFVGVLVGGFVI